MKEGIESLKKHEWFSGFDWEGLIKRSIIAPYTPDVGEMYEEIDEEPLTPVDPWDYLLDKMSEDSDSDIPEIVDSDLLEYKNSIPSYWDERF